MFEFLDVIRVEVQKGLEGEGNKQTILDQKLDPSKPAHFQLSRYMTQASALKRRA